MLFPKSGSIDVADRATKPIFLTDPKLRGDLRNKHLAWRSDHANGADPFAEPHTLLSHYTSIDVAYEILENGVMHASNARFSNDDEEIKIGYDVLRVPTSDPGSTRNYILCFCDDDDLLSMWRGYADGGVSLTMDLSAPQWITILGLSNVSKLVLPVEAVYVSKTDAKKDPHAYWSWGLKASALRRLTRFQPRLKELATEQVARNFAINPADVATHYPNEAAQAEEDLRRTLIPYMKDIGFKEEREARLVFQLDREEEGSVIWYRTGDDKLRRPKIYVRYGRPDEDSDDCRYVALPEEWAAHGSWMAELAKKVPDTVSCLYYHSTGRQEVFVGPGQDQENVVSEIRNLRSYPGHPDQYRVFPDGRWPVRSITVGPRPDQDQTVELLKHFVSTKWWLEDVQVEPSKIPYRRR